MKTIDGIVPFWVDAESNPFFGALASALLPALGYGEQTPYYCAPKGSYCIQCGACGDKPTLHKHHLQLYHVYQSVTGVGLGWYWPEDPESRYQVIEGGGPGWDWPDWLFDYIAGVAGLTWRRLSKGAGREALLSSLASSVDAGQPVLMKLGRGADWHLVTGYDAQGRLCGWDARCEGDQPTVAADAYDEQGRFCMSGWFEPFETAILFTGRTAPTLGLAAILSRMIAALERPQHALMEAEVMRRIDAAGEGNARATALWLNERVGIPIEARWHVASTTDSTLQEMTQSEAVRAHLMAVTAQYVFDRELEASHGTCWKIWGLLGVGPETGYALPADAEERLLRPETRAELKRLFAIVFENDRVALGRLRAARALLGAGAQ